MDITQRQEVADLVAEIDQRSRTDKAKRTPADKATEVVADIYISGSTALTFGYL